MNSHFVSSIGVERRHKSAVTQGINNKYEIDAMKRITLRLLSQRQVLRLKSMTTMTTMKMLLLKQWLKNSKKKKKKS